MTDKKTDPTGGLEVQVYRSSRRADTYLFLPLDDEFSELPETLLEHFGEGTPFLSFHLHAERHLEQSDPVKVLAALSAQGFYLQLPPSKDDPTDG